MYKKDGFKIQQTESVAAEPNSNKLGTEYINTLADTSGQLVLVIDKTKGTDKPAIKRLLH